MLQLFGTRQMILCKQTLKSLHRRAIKIVLLKRTSLTDKDHRKTAQILPLSSRLMSNKARFVNKIVSGRAPIYLSKLLINQSSRNSSGKLNLPIPRIDLFKSSLVYSGPAPLWNSLPSELRLPVSPSVFKKRLTLHMLSPLGVKCS